MTFAQAYMMILSTLAVACMVVIVFKDALDRRKQKPVEAPRHRGEPVKEEA